MQPQRPAAENPSFVVRGTEISAADSPHQRLQKLARITLDEMFHMVGVLDTDGTLLACNRAALEGGGLTRADVLGRPFWETMWWTVTPETQANLREAIGRAARGELVRYDVEVYARKSGKEIMMMDFTLLPVRDETGRVVYLLPEGRDITERKAREREIAEKNVELSGLLERIRELDEIKTQFFAYASRELRDPLSPIRAALEVMKRQGGDGHERARTVIERQVDHLTRLVDDLLDVSHIARGKVVLKKQRVALATLVASGIELASPQLEQATHTLEVEVPRSGLDLDADPTRIGQVVANLLSNAARYSPSGGHISVRATREGNDVLLCVRDTGIG